MSSILFYILTFVFVIGVLVTVHEFGHFWVARRLGVKVLKFSIGFGKPLLRWRRKNDETEYVLARIPLGGYVKMLDERSEDVDDAELPYAFNRKPVLTRIAIVLAGPVFNFLLAILFYWVVFIIGEQGLAPVIDDVRPATLAAESGIAPGDRITAIDGEKIQIWGQVGISIIDAVLGGKESISISLTGADLQAKTATLSLKGVTPDHMQRGLINYIGIQPRFPPWPAIIAELTPGEAAERAGLKPGDEIISFDGKPVSSWPDWVAMIKSRPGEQAALQFRRQGNQVQTVDIRVGQKSSDGINYGFVGAVAKARPEVPESLLAVVQYSPLQAVGMAVNKTGQISILTLKMLGKMVIGEASVKNISGPITIAQVAGDSLSIGLIQFLTFMAVISVSLGVLNLLPIPVLDGGHLLYYLAELIKGSPVSEKTQLIGQQVGLVLLGLLMTVAFYNDVMRLI